MAIIIKRPDYYLCSNCRFKQPSLTEVCVFCGEPFSNYEEELIKILEESKTEEFDL